VTTSGFFDQSLAGGGGDEPGGDVELPAARVLRRLLIVGARADVRRARQPGRAHLRSLPDPSPAFPRARAPTGTRARSQPAPPPQPGRAPPHDRPRPWSSSRAPCTSTHPRPPANVTPRRQTVIRAPTRSFIGSKIGQPSQIITGTMCTMGGGQGANSQVGDRPRTAHPLASA